MSLGSELPEGSPWGPSRVQAGWGPGHSVGEAAPPALKSCVPGSTWSSWQDGPAPHVPPLASSCHRLALSLNTLPFHAIHRYSPGSLRKTPCVSRSVPRMGAAHSFPGKLQVLTQLRASDMIPETKPQAFKSWHTPSMLSYYSQNKSTFWNFLLLVFKEPNFLSSVV